MFYNVIEKNRLNQSKFSILVISVSMVTLPRLLFLTDILHFDYFHMLQTRTTYYKKTKLSECGLCKVLFLENRDMSETCHHQLCTAFVCLVTKEASTQQKPLRAVQNVAKILSTTCLMQNCADLSDHECGVMFYEDIVMQRIKQLLATVTYCPYDALFCEDNPVAPVWRPYDDRTNLDQSHSDLVTPVSFLYDNRAGTERLKINCTATVRCHCGHQTISYRPMHCTICKKAIAIVRCPQSCTVLE